jgi:hypothetical protein
MKLLTSMILLNVKKKMIMNIKINNMKQLLSKIELWIDIHLVYFLYNGNKTQRYYDYLEQKWNIKK